MKFSHISKSRAKMRLDVAQYPISGTYFITISCFENQPKFGHISNGKMILNDFGKIAEENWYTLFERFPNAENVIVQIMPNHFHALIRVCDLSRKKGNNPNSESTSQNSDLKKGSLLHSRSYPIPPISEIIGAYKSIVTITCLNKFKANFKPEENIPYMGKIWHRSFWERIIRTNLEFENVKKYIKNNPINWAPKTHSQEMQ